jgi:hypothetical protein
VGGGEISTELDLGLCSVIPDLSSACREPQ